MKPQDCMLPGTMLRAIVLLAGLAGATLTAQEYLMIEETWYPGGVSGWTAPYGFLALSAPGGADHAGVLVGRFAAQGFAFPDSDAFTASGGASMGRFTQAYFAAGSRTPLRIGFDLLAADVRPSSCLLRLTGGVGTTNTVFRSVLPQVGAAGAWIWIEAPLDDPAGWIGGTPAQFTNVLRNVASVELRLTRSGTGAQEYRVDNFMVAWRIDDPLADSDGDGLPDTYELAHTGSATGLAPGIDSDGDGVVNSNEYAAVSDPLDAGSRLRILSLVKASGEAHLRVQAYPGRRYQIERSPSLQPADWQPAGEAVPGDGTRMQLTDPAPPAGPACFYRVTLTR